MGHVLISAAHKSSGKTTVTAGICAALHARGLSVQPFKKGPDFIDPMWLSLAAGRTCRNLDFYTQSPDEILAAFARHAASADIAVVEGNKGLYDGLDLDGSTSNAALAASLGAPVILVLETRGMTRGIAPLILGYQAFDPGIRIAGVILNKVGGPRHEGKLRAIIEHYTDVPVLGAVHQDPALAIDERHLGLMPSNEAAHAVATVDRLGRAVAAQVDLDRLLAIAAGAAPVAAAAKPHLAARRRDLRIAVARDSAFGFYYPGDLEGLEAAGAELVPFSPLADRRLPPCDGLFIGGGFPETHMAALEANVEMREDVRAALAAGLPAYAECGGLMYLSRSLTWQGVTCEMAGAVPADTVMHDRPKGRGYVRLRETASAPWRAAGAPAREIQAHEFHYSSLENLDPGLPFAYEVLRGHGTDGHRDGLIVGNLLAGYAHLRHVDAHPWTARFADFVRARRGGAAAPASRALGQ
ncbi:MAG: cobyrinate a,c-diamide synthase [Hyphomicrobiales bacterium]|nr:cobyrinate a,c-diamide synthase [Hyphomicrobiales bacterium]MCP5374344.1 cobyrinate a,c-diamide synthase [Hyphomicrobiales bacterium]